MSMSAPQPRLSRAHAVWAVAVLAYLCGVTARSAFGVASVEGAARFGVDGTVLSLFGVVQLGTYAAAQIPAGLLLDRIGPRRMLVIGAVAMGLGQLCLAFATDVPTALIGRLLTGIGDAATLVSMVRIIATWFQSSLVPLLTQVAMMIGQFGQALSAGPFFAVLVGIGWSAAWGGLGVMMLISLVLILAIARDDPDPDAEPEPPTSARMLLRDVLTSRGAWSGVFLHWTCLVTVNAFLFLWGVPYLTALGIPAPKIAMLLTLNVIIMVALGPLVGLITGRRPSLRPLLGWIASAIMTLTWIGTLLAPGPLGFWQLLPLIAALAVGSATCAVGFDLARTAVPRRAIGTATGLVNIGGFSGSLLSVLLIGVVLDLRSGGAPTTLNDFRVALAAQGVLVLAGWIGLWLTTRRLHFPTTEA